MKRAGISPGPFYTNGYTNATQRVQDSADSIAAAV